MSGLRLLHSLHRHGFHYGENGHFHFYLPLGSGGRATRKKVPILCSVARNPCGDGFDLSEMRQPTWFCKQLVIFVSKDDAYEQGGHYHDYLTRLLDRLSNDWGESMQLCEETPCE